jgi:hypothetical protein
VFLSKIWFFLLAIAAGAAITLALVMPRPAERAQAKSERARLQRACSAVDVLLRAEAGNRVRQVSTAARGYGFGAVTVKASKGDLVSAEDNAAGRKQLVALSKAFEEASIPTPTFLFLVDKKGRVVTRQGVEEKAFGDTLSGYYALDDALAGYMRDDVWLYGGKMYRVAVTPVFTDSLARSGALVIGYGFDNDFAGDLGTDLSVNIGFYANGEAMASNHPVQVHEDIVKVFKDQVAGKPQEKKNDCLALEPFEVTSGGKTYNTLMSRIPGEASESGTFYAVFVDKPTGLGFMGTLDNVKKDDLSFSNFPWIGLGVLFIVIVGVGLGLMAFEVDLPMRKLSADAVDLAKSESKERLDEDSHRSKYGSIARSINIHIDKLNREARAAKKEFDQLIGPAPGDSGNIGLPGLSAPKKSAPPPPSQFKFGGPKDSGGSSDGFDIGGIPKAPAAGAGGLDLSSPSDTASKAEAPKPPPPKPKPPTPKPKPPIPTTAKPPAPEPVSTEAPTVADDGPPADMAPPPAGDSAATGDSDPEEAYFQEIYQDFVALKKRCGENTDSLTFEKFARKLRKNRDALITKHGCKSVKFQVYIKDGKAALKASPVKS